MGLRGFLFLSARGVVVRWWFDHGVIKGCVGVIVM